MKRRTHVPTAVRVGYKARQAGVNYPIKRFKNALAFALFCRAAANGESTALLLETEMKTGGACSTIVAALVTAVIVIGVRGHG